MARNDVFNGWALILVSCAVFSYYSFWVLILPIVNADHPIHSYFPSKYYALLIPVFIMMVVGTLTASFIALVMIRSEDNADAEVPWSSDADAWRARHSPPSR